MSFTVTPLTMAELMAQWDRQLTLRAPFPFMSPEWLDAWWRSFSGDDKLHLRTVTLDGETIGLAPLRVKNGTAQFIGSANVCDYLDFIAKEGSEAAFFETLLSDLKTTGIERLELEALRPDSITIRHLLPLAKEQGMAVELTDTDVTLEMSLPDDWDAYLMTISTHQRHEVKRKGRRLDEAGNLVFDIKPPQNVEFELTALIRLLRISRQDKAEFMTPDMEVFFRDLAAAMHRAGWLRFGHIKLDDDIIASVMCFDYNDTRYLYNSGYEPMRAGLSVGLLSKVYSIKDAIDQKMRKYDFLKGAEVYKYHLGGQEIPVSRVRIELSGGK